MLKHSLLASRKVEEVFKMGPFPKKWWRKTWGTWNPLEETKQGGLAYLGKKLFSHGLSMQKAWCLMTLLSGPPPASINPAFSLLPMAPCCPQGLPYGNLCARS